MAATLILALVAAACTGGFSDDPVIQADPDRPGSLTPSPDTDGDGGGDTEAGGSDAGSPQPDDAPGTDDDPPDDSERIAVQDTDGTLFTIRPDGGDLVVLADDGRFHSQPVWSPDAGRLAWSTFAPDSTTTTVASARFDGTAWAEVATPAGAFYLSWDPTSARVATLSGGVAGVDVGVVDISAGDGWRRIDRGEPYWFVWGPDGEELLVHADGLRLDRVDLDGTTVIVESAPAPFLTPAWTFEARSLIYPTTIDGAATLVTSGTEGEGALPLFTYDGLLRFAVSPAINRMAVLTAEVPEPDDGIVTASAPLPAQIDPDNLPHLEVDTFALLATFGSDPTVLSEEDVVAFWWSPGGEALGWLEPAADGEPGQLQWWFLNTDGFVPGPVFTPSTVWARDYLPFFDQYGRSHSLWSPDGTAVTYAGTSPDGRSGVWVHEVALGAEPRFLADGVVSVWSPAPAGSGASSPL
ncbi:MAG: hypothetical protein RIE08_06815 [Acidimicrobiales bacterium]